MLILTFMSFLNQKVSISVRGKYQWWSIISYILFGIMAGSLLFSAILVYNYTFRTLEDAHTIVLLNTDTVVNNVNLDMYKRATDAINLKNSPSGVSQTLRNVFSYNTSSPVIVPVISTTTSSTAP
jgi:hypothetical protein